MQSRQSVSKQFRLDAKHSVRNELVTLSSTDGSKLRLFFIQNSTFKQNILLRTRKHTTQYNRHYLAALYSYLKWQTYLYNSLLHADAHSWSNIFRPTFHSCHQKIEKELKGIYSRWFYTRCFTIFYAVHILRAFLSLFGQELPQWKPQEMRSWAVMEYYSVTAEHEQIATHILDVSMQSPIEAG